MQKEKTMEREEILENFQHFDKDGDGRIDLSEFGKLCQALGGEISDEQRRIGFEAIDTNGNGFIDFDEFYGWWSDR
jgi:Ca2+-binding EF-hand superfamily protein